MQKLLGGIHSFQSSYFQANRELFEHLSSKGQRPDVLFFTCADSRVVPDLITNASPGELFTVRNAGNIIPPYDPHNVSGEAASAEYAVEVLGVKDIIVCGHTQCGAMHAILHPEEATTLEFVLEWVKHGARTRAIIQEAYPHLRGNDLVTAAVEENVLVQLEHLRTHPAVATRLARGDLGLHGWVYKIATGEVYAYESSNAQFQPVVEASPSIERQSVAPAIRAI